MIKMFYLLYSYFLLFFPSLVWAQLPYVLNLGNFAEDIRVQSYSDDLLGTDLAIGDFNGDGFADILAGAYSFSVREDLRFSIGRAYIIFGGAEVSSIVDLRSTNGHAVVITGDDPRDFTGYSVGAGDVNGDGISDAIIGSFQFTHPISKGVVYIVYGRKDWPDAIDLDTNGGPVEGVTRIIGARPGDTIGQICASGDVNGDGYFDIIIGAPGTGEEHELAGLAGVTYILYGRQSLPAIVDLGEYQYGLTTVHGSAEWRIGEFGYCFDINQDGYWDILLSDPHYGPVPGHGFRGAVLLIYGHPDLPTDIYTDSSPISPFGTTAILGKTGERLGFAFGAGDMNHNNINELCIDSIDGDNYVLFDFPNGLGEERTISVNDYNPKIIFQLTSDFSKDIAISDINGDNFDDLIVGSGYEIINDWHNAGRTFIIYGSAAIRSGLLDLRREEERNRIVQLLAHERSLLGHAVAAGDINGDSINDVVVSGPEARTVSGNRSGEVYVIYGRSANTLSPKFEKGQLLQSFPNPFNANTVIRYQLAQTQPIRMAIYNARGQKVRQLVDGVMEAGEHRAIWDGHDDNFEKSGSGIYFCRIVGESFVESIKLLYLR